MGAPDKHQLFSQAKIYSEENVWSRKLPLQFIGCTFLANPKPGLWSSLPPKKWKETCKYTKYTLLLRPISQVESVYTAISRKVVGKNVHATIPKGNMGYNQYTVPDDCSCQTYFCCFPLALANTFPWPFVPILSNFFEKQRTLNGVIPPPLTPKTSRSSGKQTWIGTTNSSLFMNFLLLNVAFVILVTCHRKFHVFHKSDSRWSSD